MKRMVFVLLLNLILISLTKGDKIWFPNFVECYYSGKTAEPLLIYDAFDGEVIETLPTLKKGLWYKIAITKSINGWFKIENIQIAPGIAKDVIIKVIMGLKINGLKQTY